MTIVLSSTVIMLLPLLAVFLIFCGIAAFSYNNMSSGGGDAGMIGAMWCFFGPIIATIAFAIPYGFAILMFKLFH